MTTPAKYPDYTCTFAEVYLAELDYIIERRKKMGLTSETVESESERVHQKINEHTDNKKDSPDTEQEARHSVRLSSNANLIGLALSGGGIRSATFNLGLLQTFDKKGILRYCDHLSTVSGGGYIGSCLSSLLTNPEASTDSSAEQAQFPFRFHRDSESDENEDVDYKLQAKPDNYRERREINYLRSTKNYLQLKNNLFSLETWRFLATFFSGQMLINLIPLAILIFATYGLFLIETPVAQYACIPVENVEVCSDSELEEETSYLKLNLDQWDIIGLPSHISKKISSEQHYCYTESSFCSKRSEFCGSNKKTCQEPNDLRKFSTEGTQVKFNLLMYYLFVFAISAFFVMVFMRLLAVLTNLHGSIITKLQTVAAILTVISLTIAGLIAATYFLFLDADGKVSQQLLDLVNYTLLTSLIFFVLGRLETKNRILQKILKGMLSIALVVLIPLLFAKFLHLLWTYRIFQTPLSEFLEMPVLQFLDIIPIPITAILVLLAISLLVNINRISLHAFYRNGLSNTYLIKRKDRKIVPNMEVKLKELHEHHNGPYHLINAALNLQGSKNRHLSGRGADYFIFSKLYCGAESTGYQSTELYNEGQTKLAAAMAISGAAASPARGEQTNSLIAFYMILLNIRLNVWMPNPNPQYLSKIPTIWPLYFGREFLAHNRETNSLINLSDGGHHENLGGYALLKRYCRLIIISDAGCDPEYKMNDLANLQRKARIDLGINIELDMSPLRPDSKKNTESYFVKGTIHYPNDTDGILFYIKTTMTGAEPEDLLAYRRKSPTFPDETTANQFFKEDQFESYRKLGEVAAKDMCVEIEKTIKDIFG